MLKKTLLIYNICLLLENMILCETVNSVFLHAESALSLIESLEFEESTTNTSDTKYTTSYIEVKNGLTGSENHHVYTSTPVSMVPEAHLEKLQEQKLEEYVVTPPEQGENKGMKQENLNIETAYHFDGTDDFFKFSNWSLHFSEYFQISFAFIPGNTLKYMQIIVLAHLTDEKYSETGVFLASVTADDTLLVTVALNDSNYEVRQHFWNRSPERHFVQTNLENDQLEVTIDNTTRYASAVKSETSERYKDFKNKALFIGGIPNNTKENINFLSNATNFNGCISNLNIKTTGSDIWPLVDIRNGGKFIQNGLPTLGTCTIFSSASSEEWVSSESDIMAGSTTYDDISENGSTNFTEEEFLTSNMSTTAIPPVITSSNMWPWALLGCTIFTLIMIGCVCLMRKCSSKPSKSNVGAEHQRSVSQVKEEIPLLAREQGGLNRNSMPQNEQNFKRQSRGSNEKDTKQDDILLKSSNKHTEESERTYQSPTILPDALNYNNKESEMIVPNGGWSQPLLTKATMWTTQQNECIHLDLDKQYGAPYQTDEQQYHNEKVSCLLKDKYLNIHSPKYATKSQDHEHQMASHYVQKESPDHLKFIGGECQPLLDNSNEPSKVSTPDSYSDIETKLTEDNSESEHDCKTLGFVQDAEENALETLDTVYHTLQKQEKILSNENLCTDQNDHSDSNENLCTDQDDHSDSNKNLCTDQDDHSNKSFTIDMSFLSNEDLSEEKDNFVGNEDLSEEDTLEDLKIFLQSADFLRSENEETSSWEGESDRSNDSRGEADFLDDAGTYERYYPEDGFDSLEDNVDFADFNKQVNVNYLKNRTLETILEESDSELEDITHDTIIGSLFFSVRGKFSSASTSLDKLL